jgi:thiamine pyrophosphokinase
MLYTINQEKFIEELAHVFKNNQGYLLSNQGLFDHAVKSTRSKIAKMIEGEQERVKFRNLEWDNTRWELYQQIALTIINNIKIEDDRADITIKEDYLFLT